MRLSWIRARAFVYATEDEARVRTTLLWALGLPDDAPAHDRVDRLRARGHYGDEILVLEATLKEAKLLERAWTHVASSPALLQKLRESLGRRLDEDHVLHLRLDKQAAVEHRLALTDRGDALVVRLKAPWSPSENPVTSWAQALTTDPGAS